MPTERVGPRVLIAGVSVRAFAVSAARAGYQVTAIDAFGDLDLRDAAEVIVLRPEHGVQYSPRTAVAAAQALPAPTVAYTANFENYPGAVGLLSQRRRLLGNPSSVLLRVRNPIELMRTLNRRGFVTPSTRTRPPSTRGRTRSWLLKPRRSGGGHETAPWHRGQPVPRTHYLQERISGIPGSVVFAADGRRAIPLGITRQLVGDARFGARGFRYCGSLLGPETALFPRQQGLLDVAAALADVVTQEFGLVGLNGIDFIARNGVPYPIEVNPRYSASMELVERAGVPSIFEVHARACQGDLPVAPAPLAHVHGKAIVFARREAVLGDTRPWLERGWFGDIPHPGERIHRNRPICTVFATGKDVATCYRQLVKRAASVYRASELSKRGAA